MAQASVRQHTRHTKNGTVTVQQHRRAAKAPAGYDNGGQTPVQQLRRERLKAEATKRRKEAMRRGGTAARKGWKATKRRARQSLKLARRGGKNLYRAADMLGRKRRAAATVLVFAGLAEIFAAVAWQGIGITVTTLSILAAAIAGGLLIGGRARRRAKGSR
ncbi:MAG: hypothetical protein ACRDJ9_15735 [Dehalococcoidia bacterium]